MAWAEAWPIRFLKCQTDSRTKVSKARRTGGNLLLYLALRDDDSLQNVMKIHQNPFRLELNRVVQISDSPYCSYLPQCFSPSGREFIQARPNRKTGPRGLKIGTYSGTWPPRCLRWKFLWLLASSRAPRHASHDRRTSGGAQAPAHMAFGGIRNGHARPGAAI